MRPLSRQSNHIDEKFTPRNCGGRTFSSALLAELSDTMGEARHFPAGGLLMDDATLRGTHDNRFGSPERRHCHLRVAAGDRFFDFADRIAQQSAARLVDFGLRAILRVALRAELVLAMQPLVDDWCFSAEKSAKAPFFAR